MAAVAATSAERFGAPIPAPAVRQASLVPVAAAVQPVPAPSSAIATSVARWNSLRQSDNLPFSSYASFLLNHRGWPGESAMRRAAERQIDPASSSAAEVIRYFSVFPPLTASGHARHAFALLASGRADEARTAARAAWHAGAMPATDEQRLLGAFGGALTPQDHDRRMDVLLANGDTQSAQRALAWSSPSRRPLYSARLALQSRAADARGRVDSLGPGHEGDPGLLIDKASWLRTNGDPLGARQLLGRPRRLAAPPANAEKFMETMVTMARGAANDRQWTLVYQIASQVDDIFPAGTDVSRQSYGERDEYTNLTWLAGSAAMRTGRTVDAARMFERYGRAAQSPQTRAKGFYWAARAAAAAGQTQQSNAWLELAASSPDQFYGQLAMERLGRRPPPPAAAPPADPAERAALLRRPLAEAVRYLGMVGDRANQTLFIRALAAQLQTDRERAIASELGRQIGRLDMGVWAAREARSSGASFYSRGAFPEVGIPPAYRSNWAFAHGIMRQESSFDRSAVSSAGARGMMQLMPATAAQEARRLGVDFSVSRLTEDPNYNILLGSHHLAGLMERWGGNAVLVAAAYNAGSGNVNRWVASNGDPRRPGADVLQWIEDIPFAETRNYVQRVIENTMVYDSVNPQGSRSQGRISYYLGQRPAR
ncbi:MAG TPA: lytic transglycosylase domain-containing protein [Allosphingosinicella sp.]|nr:lytic transglycosylase domain-containing protein [Allosphingosinicella sp.]